MTPLLGNFFKGQKVVNTTAANIRLLNEKLLPFFNFIHWPLGGQDWSLWGYETIFVEMVFIF